MKKTRINNLPAIAFVFCLLILFVVGIRPFLVSAYVGTGYLKSIHSADSFDEIEKYFNDAVPTKKSFLDINGLVDRITGKRIHNEYVKLDNGELVYVVEKEDTKPFADAIVLLDEYMKNTINKPLLYVQFPFQIDPDDKQLPPGVEDYSNENADEFLAIIKEKGVKTYDFRPFLKSQPDYYSLFYRTDHHWKAETGFRAAAELFDYLAAQDASFAVDKRITDINNYRVDHYDNFFGSTGRHFGLLYSGYESFNAINPTFGLSISVYDMDGKLLHSGGVENTVLFPQRLSYENHYECKMYSYYMEGDHDYRRYINRSHTLNVVPKKILVVKDSYANAILPYMVYGYEEVTVVDLRALDGVPLTDIIRQVEPDLLMVAYDPGVLKQEFEKMFRFFP